MKAHLFPGQGGQRVGMGARLFRRFPELVARANDVLGYSIEELCLEDPRRELNLTQFTQPAIYVVNALAFFEKQAVASESADVFAGHSLGELNALMAAGSFDFVRGLQLVKKRGELMSKVSGSMAAINASADRVAAMLAKRGETRIDVVVDNSPEQCVIGGSTDDIERVRPLFDVPPLTFHLLRTSGPFHSRYMKEVEAEFYDYLRSFDLRPPQVPVIANVSARPHRADELARTLAAQISNPVRWRESILHLMEMPGMQFEEIGDQSLLTVFLGAIAAHRSVDSRAPERPASKELSAAERASRWNAVYPVGTKVRSRVAQGRALETRTEARVLFGHRAVVYLKGHRGYFDIDHLEPTSCDSGVQSWSH